MVSWGGIEHWNIIEELKGEIDNWSEVIIFLFYNFNYIINSGAMTDVRSTDDGLIVKSSTGRVPSEELKSMKDLSGWIFL